MHWMLSAAIRPLVLTMVFCGASVFTACSSNDDNPAGQTDVSAISDKVWAFIRLTRTDSRLTSAR